MATVTVESCIEQIGETAGIVWQVLDDEGSVPLTKLVKKVSAPRDQVMQAIGWLAREDKLLIEEEGRKKIVSLRELDE
jgi:hypothetical protein